MSKTNQSLLGTGLLAALAASLCCITPLLAVVGGLGASAASFSWLAPFRPFLVALTVGVLAFAWYQALKPAGIEDDCGCAVSSQKPVLQSKAFLGFVTVLATVLLAFPYYGTYLQPQAAVAPTSPASTAESPVWQTASYRIKGMTCEACARHVEQAVQRLPGVQSVTVSYDQATALVRFDATKSPVAQVQQAINGTGYHIVPSR
ncbi:mercuric transport protein MerTP (plasmid) [Hymenobacter oligotrophus]|uniref:Mercuric transport protein MerT n=1 Tax=Hymenobacter oligotrophus TaxID=2319843 RepID=A0A3B7R788_9BACT|nr:mercuric transport protein MerTP [Hymenobacter oligotrophus]AYA39090.1 mercuric transport protein MerTP [Hymenobacter oligotrophus]